MWRLLVVEKVANTIAVLQMIDSGLEAVAIPYSYGFSIIILTFLVKVATFPLTQKQVWPLFQQAITGSAAVGTENRSVPKFHWPRLWLLSPAELHSAAAAAQYLDIAGANRRLPAGGVHSCCASAGPKCQGVAGKACQ